MMKCTTLCATLCFGAQLIAADGLSGTWKFDPVKSKGAGWAQYGKQGDFIVWSNASGTMAKFKIDGKDHPTVNRKGTISFKRIDKNTLEATSKAGADVLSTSTMTFSSGGKSRTVVQKGTDATGKPYQSITKSTRAGSASDQANPLIGKWEIDRSTIAGTFPLLVIDVKGDKIALTGPNSYEASFDGKDYPVKRSANADTVSVRRINERKVETTMKLNGQVAGTGTLEVSPDGKTLTITNTRNNATTTNVFARQ
jgi:hypothetical protein